MLKHSLFALGVLLLTGAAVTFAFAGGYWNIGVEGQLYAGAVAATAIGLQMDDRSPWLALPLMIVGGFVAGMLWALIPALMKVKLAIDEVVTTLLLNSVALFIVSALLNGPWRDPISQWPQSPEIAASAIFPKLIPRSRLHLGFILAVIIIVALWFVLTRTAFGLRMRAVGLGPEAARFAGINVGRTMLISALVSGGIAGLAGVSEVAGIHYHLIDAISPGYGYTGIIIATLGTLNAWGVALAALFIGLIDTGAQTVSRALGVPAYLGDVIQAVLLLVTLGMLLLQSHRIRWQRN
jgi:simple sugar transport system permease protein